MLAPWKKSFDKPRQYIKKQRYHFADKGLYSQSYGFSSCHVQMWELNHKEGWVPSKWCFQTVVLEKTLESPLDCKGIKSVNPKGNQPWIFIGRTDAEAKAGILWPLDVKSQLIKKDPDAGKDWRHSLRALPETNSTIIQKCNHILRLEKYPFCSFKLWQRVLFSSVRLKDLGAGMGLSLPRYTVVPWWPWKQSSVSYRVWHVVNECLLWSE